MAGIDKNTVFYLRGDSYNDLSEYSRNITFNSTTIASDPNGVQGIKLTSGYMLIPNCLEPIDWSKDFTLEWWEYRLSASADAQGGVFQNRVNTVSTNVQYGILIGYCGTKIYVGSAHPWTGLSEIVSKDLTANTWVHWAYVKSGNTWSSYKNGTLFWTVELTDIPHVSDKGLCIGAWVSNTVNAGYNGLIKGYRISNIARYTENFTVNDDPYSYAEASDLRIEKNKFKYKINKINEPDITKIETYINNELINVTNEFNELIECNYEDSVYLTNNDIIQVVITYANNLYDSYELKCQADVDLDNNTVFFLRGDGYNDLSITSNEKQITNSATSISAIGKFGRGIDYSAGGVLYATNGTKDIDVNGDFTVEWWEYAKGSMSNGAMFYNNTNRSTYAQNSILLAYTGTKIYTGNTTSWNGFNAIISKDITANTWVHWAYVKTGSTWTSYKNGVKFWSATNALKLNVTDGGLTIGKWDSTDVYNAVISEYRISNIARYTENFTPNDRPMTSVNIRYIGITDNAFECYVHKNESENIEKVEIYLNNELYRSLAGVETILFNIDETDLVIGSNTFEVKIYYYGDYYVNASTTCFKSSLEKLPTDASLIDTAIKLKEIVNTINKYTDDISQVLINNNFEVSDNEKRLSNLAPKIDECLKYTPFPEWFVTTESWMSAANMPAAKWSYASAVINDKIYTVGDSNTTCCYNPKDNTWTTLANSPAAMTECAAFAVGTNLYYMRANANYCYDTILNSWTTKANIPTSRNHPRGGAVGTNIYVIGGYSGAMKNNNECYDTITNTWTTKQAATVAKETAGGVSLNGKVYIMGGYNGSTRYTNMDEYDPVLNSWTAKANMNYSKERHMFAVHNGLIYTLGGYNGSSAMNNVEYYDIESNTWTVCITLRTNRNYGTAASAGGNLYVMGGSTDSGTTKLNTVDCYIQPKKGGN